MKLQIVAGAILILFAAVSGNAKADVNCETNGAGTNPPITGAALTALITNSLVCGRPGPSYPGGATSTDRWQEEHISTFGALYDFKEGPSDPVDPRKQVGTWSIRSNQVTHIYFPGGAGLIFTWDVRPVPAAANTYSFCAGNAEHVRAIIVANAANTNTACASFPP